MTDKLKKQIILNLPYLIFVYQIGRASCRERV